MRLIDKDELIAFILSRGVVSANALETFREIDAVPVVHGEWISKTYITDGEKREGIACSVCGKSRVDGIGKAKYCPNCGAKMKEET